MIPFFGCFRWFDLVVVVDEFWVILMGFAAKEAVAKAWGTGIGEAAAFREIEVVHDSRGAPAIRLHGAAARTAAAQASGDGSAPGATRA